MQAAGTNDKSGVILHKLDVVSTDDYRWLVSPAARPWLRRWTGCDVNASLMKDIRRHLSADRARLVAEQVSLRARAGRKFPHADRLFLLARALEQATDHAIASYKAASFPAGGHVADVGCGIGGDAMALAASRSLLAVDTDPVCCLLAEANLRVAGAEQFRVKQEHAARLALAEFDFWHTDPDRRPDGRRTVRTTRMRPSAAELTSLLRKNPHAALKWAPASRVPPDLARDAEREWIGHAASCQQQLVRTGALARFPGRRVATILLPATEGVPHPHIIVESESDAPEPTAQLSSYLMEPHAAVIAAGLASQWAAHHGCVPLSSRVAYFTGEQPASDPSAASFRILDQLPLRLPKIRDWLRRRHACVVEVKKRGVDIVPQQWVQALPKEGDRRLSLIAFPLGPRRVAVLAERMR